jgi:ribosomal protein L40E
MKGPLQLIPRRRAEAAPQAEPEPATDAGATAPAESTTTSLPALEGPAGPAGVDPVEARRPTFRTRSRARRRLRYLRRVRELGFRDLGGLLFDQHRFSRPNEDLVSAKLGAIAEVDSELRALERVLDDRRPIAELREPGVSACPRCGALHASEARFCSSCGLQLRGPRAVAEIGEAAGGLASPSPSTPPPPLPPLPPGAPAAPAHRPDDPLADHQPEGEQPTTVMEAAGSGDPATRDPPEP